MPNFLVTIMLPGRTRAEVESKLRTAFGSAVAQQAQLVTAGTPPNFYQACQANDHFGCVHWTDEDLRNKFKELNIPMTPESLDAVKDTYAVRHIGDRMVERGWEVIEEVILDAGDGGSDGKTETQSELGE